jgi:hypothetical protein
MTDLHQAGRDAATQTLDATVAAVGSKATYTGAGMTISGWLLSSEAAVLIGIVLGVAGFMVNWFYRAREDRRQQAEHKARMRHLDDAAEEGGRL